MNKLVFLFSVLLPVFSVTANSAEVTIPNQFSAGTAAVAADVNANFSAVETAVDGNAVDIAAILNTITALEVRVNTLEADNTQLQADKVAMQNFIDEVLPFMEGGMDAQDQPTVFFSGANVHVNNGEGSTDTVNGLGNLIVGYDEVASSATGFCTVVTLDGSAPSGPIGCAVLGGIWGGAAQKIGSHNLAVGAGHNYTQYGGVVSGLNNTIAGVYSSVTGGRTNISSGNSSAISGGSRNSANGANSAVSGGFSNSANGANSAVSGGDNRTASGVDSWAAGSLFENN